MNETTNENEAVINTENKLSDEEALDMYEDIQLIKKHIPDLFDDDDDDEISKILPKNHKDFVDRKKDFPAKEIHCVFAQQILLAKEESEKSRDKEILKCPMEAKKLCQSQVQKCPEKVI